MKKLFIIPAIVLGFLFFNSQSLSAQIIEKESSRTYTVNDDNISVSEVKNIKITQASWYIAAGAEEIFTLFNPVKNDPERDEKLQMTKDSIKVTDNAGRNVQYSTELTEGGNIILKVKFPIRIDSSRPYSLFLNYTSYGLIVKNAKLRDIYIPSFAKDYEFTTETSKEEISTKIIIPKKYGDINFATPQNTMTVQGDNNVINFDKESLVGETGWIQVGTEQYYNFKITQPYTATSDASFFNNKYKILIPRDIASGPISQSIYFTKISHTPSNAYKDENGNLFLEFTIPANQVGNIVIEGYSTLKQNNSIDFVDSGNLSDIPQDILEENTKAAKFWESDNIEIMETANTLKNQIEGADKNIYELISNTYKFVIDRIDYSEVKRFGINERQGALATLQGGAAVCMEYSDLFIALMRAQGVPARGAFGYGYSALDSDEDDQTINHQWAEVYIPSIKQWISVDTTWGENGQELIGGDLNHFYTHVASQSPEVPSTTEVEFYGGLSTIPSKVMNVTAVEELPSDGETGEELFTKYHKEVQANVLEDLFTKVRLLFFEIDSAINRFFKTNFEGISDGTITLIKFLPFVLIGILVISKSIRERRKRNYALKF